MSELNLNRNTFLENEELNRFQEFLINDTIASIFLNNTTSYGIVRSDFVNSTPNDFLVEVGTNVSTIKIDNLSLGVDNERLLIRQEAIDNIDVPNDSNWYWVKISHIFRRNEVGVVSVNADGELTGVNTLFTEILRGQQTNVPVKIRFISDTTLLNDQVYEVVDITDNLNCTLNGNFVVENNLRYVVIGSTPLSETITTSQREGLYKYDSCNIELIEETVVNTAPTANFVAGKQFYIARVRSVSGTVTVEDKRTDYWTFNIEGIDDKLDKSQNLADVDSVSVSRQNLGVLSESEITNRITTSFNKTEWLTMQRGTAASATDFTMRVRHVGSVVNIVGRMRIPSTPSSGDELCFINYTQTTGNLSFLRPTTRIFYTSAIVANNDENKGANVYIDETDTTKLSIQVIDAIDTDSLLYYFNITYIAG